MEYFIARKVRPVFDVYRKVFHKVSEQKPLSQLEVLQLSINLLVEQDKRLNAVECKVETILQKQQEAERELKSLPISNEKVPEMATRDKIRLLVNRYCSATGAFQQTVWDNVYQKLYYLYHIHIKSYNKQNGESWLDIADKNGFTDKIYNITSDLLRERGIAIN